MLQDIVHRTKTLRLLKHKRRWKTANIVEQGTCWENALHMAKKKKNSKWFVGECIGSSQTGREEKQSMKPDKKTSHSFDARPTRQKLWHGKLKNINLDSVRSVTFTKLRV